MSRRTLAFVLVALAGAALFLRLGFWQLARRNERRAVNAHIAAARRAAPVAALELGRPGVETRFRRITVTGTPDYARERVLGARTHGGSPGVYLLTPVRVPGRDTAVLVNRGWVYSPDGASVDATRWHEGETMTFDGWAEDWASGAPTPAMKNPAGGAPVLRRLDRAAVAGGLPYPLAPLVLVATGARGSGPTGGEAPVRLEPPKLDDGPHLGYAIQWFSFAAIAIGGAAAVVAKSRNAKR